ncbi:unnamed protein product [Trifolium pratense]|uniref:Uncharacterized protein n=1 Tax=Trifolium pratense TaxID=57577 RepID=A0ACB0M1T9_TRIPR|nr:unnamed protein product [Trifolium pratense]
MTAVPAAVEKSEAMNNVMCLLINPDGSPLGAPIYLPQTTAPQHLQQIVNKLLNNEEKLPYSFYISDQELLVPLATYLNKNKFSVEKALHIVCQPQAIFRVRPVHRCSATISGHKEAVLTVAFSPDGKQLASGSGDTTVRFWDITTQTPLYTCKGHKDWVLSIAWSPDGKYLASGSRAGELICWDPQTGKSLVSLGNPRSDLKKWITSISWEPVHLNAPCRRFVCGSKDNVARIWDISLKKCICLIGHAQSVTCVKWGGDGVIYTGSQDGTVKVWETTGKLICTLKGKEASSRQTHPNWVNSLALSTEYVLRTGAFDHTGKQFSSPEEMKKVALERYTKMRGSAPERLVSGSDDCTMYLWEPLSNNNGYEAHMTGHQQAINHVSFSPDGQWVASASFDNSVKLWNGTTGKFVATFRHVRDVYQISWSADSRLLLSGSEDTTLKVWDNRTRKRKQDLPGHYDAVYAVDWSPDGEKVASGGKDKVLKLWMG